MAHRTYLLPHEGEGTVRRTSPHGWSLRLPCVLPACTQRHIPSLKSHSGQVTQTYLADRTAEQPRALDVSSKIRDRRIDLRWTDEPNSTGQLASCSGALQLLKSRGSPSVLPTFSQLWLSNTPFSDPQKTTNNQVTSCRKLSHLVNHHSTHVTSWKKGGLGGRQTQV